MTEVLERDVAGQSLPMRQQMARYWFENLQSCIISALEKIEDDCAGPFDPLAPLMQAASSVRPGCAQTIPVRRVAVAQWPC